MERQYFMCDLWKGGRRDTFGLSVALHVMALVLVTVLWDRPTVTVKKTDMSHAVTLVAPLPLRVTKSVAATPRTALPAARPQSIPVRKPELQATAQPPAPVPQMTKIELPRPPVATPAPVARQEAKPAGFDSAKATAATTTRPAREVQTGGFGDPNGLTGQGKPESSLTVATLGSFDLPSGAGAGNGSGGSHGASGTVASAGFGSGGTGSTSGAGRAQRGVVQAGFTDATVVGAAPTRNRSTSPRMTPVEVLYKPRPAYTPEARSLRIQGEVLLNIVFLASGSLRVSRVVSGLGHGLDEAAMEAAQRIRFKPATQDGHPCDSSATVHIVFQLAE